MKYANTCLDENLSMINIGDMVQQLAVNNLYEYMGVKEIVRIPISNLSTYDGEQVVMPINYPFYGYYNLSSKITPIYLGISIMSNTVAEGLHFKENQPIGCRDMHSFLELEKAGIDAYVGGCLTLTFSKRNSYNTDGIERNMTYLVDIPEKLRKYIPQAIMDHAIEKSHIVLNCSVDEQYTKEVLNEYNSKAQLVVTSKIHCAMPCLAMGIPVIFVCEFMSFRYQVLQNLIPIYTSERFSEIDWKPKVIEFEEQKKMMLELAAKRVGSAYAKKNILLSEKQKIHDIFANEKSVLFKIDTVDAIRSYLQKKFEPEDSFEYIIWGVTQIAELTYEMISEKFPNARLSYVIDVFKELEFHNIRTVKENVLENCDAIVLLTAGAALPMAVENIKKYEVRNFIIDYNGIHFEDEIL